jgi:choline transport protein
VVFFIILIISIIQWYVDGKRNYTGPKVDIEQLQNGEVVGIAPVASNNLEAGNASGETLRGEEKTAE